MDLAKKIGLAVLIGIIAFFTIGILAYNMLPSTPIPYPTPITTETLTPTVTPSPPSPSPSPSPTATPPPTPTVTPTPTPTPTLTPNPEKIVMGVAWDHGSLNVNRGITFYVLVEGRIRQDVLSAVHQAIQDWEARIRGLQKRYIEAEDGAYDSFGFVETSNASSDIVFIIKKNTGRTALGETVLSWSDGVILSAEITMATQNVRGRPLDLADIRNIAAHEVGHALGLGHSDNPDDLMYASYDFIETGTLNPPSQCDLEAIYTIYGENGFLTYEKVTFSYIE